MEAVDYFRNQAAECRRLADDMAASFERSGLLQLARHYEAEARRAELDARQRGEAPPQPVMASPRAYS
ncbi:MAG TPA: hypothetical protein VH331_17505 [Allosphingosinicella sp.]|jgi:hypothetical protein|nr:hypothetical protein [Allosphingosinicella sp.]